MIVAKYAGPPGTENRLLGFTKEDLAELVRSEVILLVVGDQRIVLVYSEDRATLESAVGLASAMLANEAAAVQGHKC